MNQRNILFGLFIFSLFLTSCEKEALPAMEEVKVNSDIDIMSDSGSEEVPIDDKRED